MGIIYSYSACIYPAETSKIREGRAAQWQTQNLPRDEFFGTFRAEFEISAHSAGMALFYIGIKSNFRFSTPFEKLSGF